jgi:transcriptional regulator with XRE-family HTH domain
MAYRRPEPQTRAVDPAPGTAQPDPSSRRLGRPSNERFRQLFTRNLNQMLDQRADVPREAAARAAELARVCAVTPAAARKWLTGAGWPTLEKLLDLAHRYGFAPDDLLSEGPRQVVDISRLVDTQALRRAALSELTPAPPLDGASPLRMAIDPSAFASVADSSAAPAVGATLVEVDIGDTAPDAAFTPGDRVVVRLDPHWRGDGLYLLQVTSTSPAVLRRITQVADGFRIEAPAGGATVQPETVAGFAADEAHALDGSPILRGHPLCLVRTLRDDTRE